MDWSVVRVGVWQSAQPIDRKSDAPLSSDDVLVVGFGGAESRMKAARFPVADDIWLAVLVRPPPEGVWMLVESSGVGLTAQFATERSLGKTSLLTPCSTLYASPAKMIRDLFCAFQPNRVMVPSFPVVLKRPPMPRLLRWLAVLFRLLIKALSDTFSIRPKPKTGVGMRKRTLLFVNCWAKLVCARVHVDGASMRPAIV